MAEREYLLICEGDCNPTIKAVDAEVRRARGILGDQPVGDTRLLARLRRLQYTAHRMISDNHATCAACGTMRRYGGMQWAAPHV